MAATKPKPKASGTGNTWVNMVVRGADGQLLVRGVDVPKSGPVWEKASRGEPIPRPKSSRFSSAGKVLKAVTNKNKALATAKRAGLVLQTKGAPSKK